MHCVHAHVRCPDTVTILPGHVLSIRCYLDPHYAHLLSSFPWVYVQPLIPQATCSPLTLSPSTTTGTRPTLQSSLRHAPRRTRPTPRCDARVEDSCWFRGFVWQYYMCMCCVASPRRMRPSRRCVLPGGSWRFVAGVGAGNPFWCTAPSTKQNTITGT